MATKFKRAFFAFPSNYSDLKTTIETAVTAFAKRTDRVSITAWPQLELFGASIPNEVRESIKRCDVVICDVTKPNLNVYYEAGYAIGLGKAVAPVINSSFADALLDIQRDGLFDTIAYKTYENSDQLSDLLSNLPYSALLDLYSKPINFQQPIFFLDTFRKTDFRNAVASAIKDSKVFFRSFDPVEIPRFSTFFGIAQATSSSGLIIPMLESHIDDAARHNLRASFLAGLGHGLDRQTLVIAKAEGNQAADYRDLVTAVRSEAEISDLVIEFSRSASVAAQGITSPPLRHERSALQNLTLGASAAENEFRTLGSYFVETAEFVRTLRGEVNIVAGRKGSGKTAIFFRVRDRFREEKSALVVDLKPESHQLSLFREELLRIVDAGVFDHTLAAFWYFVVLTEVLLAIKRERDFRLRFDTSALAAAKEIDKVLEEFHISVSGDFTLRINRLGSYILQEIKSITAKGEKLSPDRLTNIIFRDGIGQVRALINKNTDTNSHIVFLLDNIDKGWPSRGLNDFDVRLVRLLLESLNKVRQDFNVQNRDFMSVVFLRNDIYELLVDVTPDRGKAAQIRIDWTDRAKLRQVIFKRLQASVGGKSQTFDQLWAKFFVLQINNQDSFEYLVDHCLMRPRFLITIIENALANAINRGHDIVSAEDCIDAVRQHSHYLVDDFGYEIRDVSGLSAEILYSLVGVTKLLTKDEVISRFRQYGIAEQDLETAFRLLLWYGVLGIASPDNGERYIYDYEYNMKRLEAEVQNLGADALFVANAAVHVALST